MSDPVQIIQIISIWALPVLFAITLHEVAHGWMAWRLGDPTAMLMGRLSLNPIRHIDPIGTILLPAGLVAMGSPFVFGWAKPVPVNFDGLKNPKRDSIWVSLAGPGANLGMALFWALITWLGGHLPASAAYFAEPMQLMGMAGITINLVLMVLNLIPIPPLDGGRVAAGLLPGPLSYQFSKLEPYGFIILIVLLFTGMLGTFMGPIVSSLRQLFFALGGAPML